MKKVLKIFLGIVGFIAILIAVVFMLTSGLPKTANEMFMHIKAGNIQQAYLDTAEQFKLSTTVDQFQSFIQQVGLNAFEKATRREREIINNQGILKGTIILSGGSALPMEITFVKEGGKWKILSLHVSQSGIVEKNNEENN